MTLRDLIEKAGGELDRPIYFLPSPECPDYINVVSAVVGTDDGMTDENGDQLPSDAIVLFPN